MFHYFPVPSVPTEKSTLILFLIPLLNPVFAGGGSGGLGTLDNNLIVIL